MDGLRWLLLFFGLLVIAGVYLYSRREKSKPVDESAETSVETSGERLEPTLGGHDHEVLAEDLEPRVESPTIGEQSAPIAQDAPQKIVTKRNHSRVMS